MPRRKREIAKREITPDSLYNDVLVGKFINIIMKDGKKSVAEHIFYDSCNLIKEKEKIEPLELFKKALKNVKPLVEVKARRVGGSNYQVPVEVPTQRGYSLAMRWLVASAQNRSERSMEEKLANELMEASRNTGASVKKREEVHKMAEANKAFAHYRW